MATTFGDLRSALNEDTKDTNLVYEIIKNYDDPNTDIRVALVYLKQVMGESAMLEAIIWLSSWTGSSNTMPIDLSPFYYIRWGSGIQLGGGIQFSCPKLDLIFFINNPSIIVEKIALPYRRLIRDNYLDLELTKVSISQDRKEATRRYVDAIIQYKEMLVKGSMNSKMYEDVLCNHPDVTLANLAAPPELTARIRMIKWHDPITALIDYSGLSGHSRYRSHIVHHNISNEIEHELIRHVLRVTKCLGN